MQNTHFFRRALHGFSLLPRGFYLENAASVWGGGRKR